MAKEKQNKTTDQVTAPNPTGKGGFGDHPENRNPGGWKKEDTPRFKLEQMMKMSFEELEKVATDKEAPLFERKMAKCLADGNWKEIREMIAEVYGTPKSSVDVTSGGQQIQTVVKIIDARQDSRSTDTN